ncbi:MAG: glycosyltransferase family 39 protein, partial [Endomicrobia bacterium]|nr:glycosyltransferase family 39 protein [Endomicrobiia bacterium]
QSIFYGISGLDDAVLVAKNQAYLGDPYNIIGAFFRSVFFSDTDYFYRPLLTVSWIADTLISGGKFWMYHLSNVLYHFIAVCILFNLLKNLGFERNRAFLFSTFFAVSPALSQAVAWIPGRNDALLSIFVFSSFLYAVKFNNAGKAGHLALAAAFFMASLLTKETAVFAVFIFVLYLYLNKTEQYKLKISVLTASFFACIFVWYKLRSAYSSEIDVLKAASMIKAGAAKFVPATLQYLGKVFYPVNLKVMPLSSSFDILLGMLVAALVAFLLYASYKSGGKINKKNVFFGAVVFLLFLSPTYFQGNVFIFEHRLYLPLLGIILILNEVSLPGIESKYVRIFLAAYFVFFASTAFINIQKFRNDSIFASAANYETNNRQIPYFNFVAYQNKELLEIGEYYVKKDFADASLSIQLKMPYNALYSAYFEWQRGNFGAAKRLLATALSKKENMHEAYGMLADIYLKENNPELAVYNIKKAFRLQPDNNEYYRYLKVCFDAQNTKR